METSLQEDAADIVVDSIEVELTDDEDPKLTARYSAHPLASGERRPILIDFSQCTLWPISISAEGASSLTFDQDEATAVDKSLLRLQMSAGWAWSDTEIVVKLKWKERPSHPSLVGDAFLYLPANLPRIGNLKRTDARVLLRTPVSLRGEYERRLAGCVPYSVGGKFDSTGPFADVVLCRERMSACGDVRDQAQIRLVGMDRRSLGEERMSRLCAKLREMCTDIGDLFQLRPELRIAAALGMPEKAPSVSGPLLTEPHSRYQLDGIDQPMRDFPIARHIASNWWGAGCRIEGADDHYLWLGISWAVGLCWTEAHIPRHVFEALYGFYAEKMVRTSRFTKPMFRPGERTVGIGIVLYESLVTNPAAWDALRRLTAEFWGCHAPEAVVLSSLKKAGVPIRDFKRRRFQRTDGR